MRSMIRTLSFLGLTIGLAMMQAPVIAQGDRSDSAPRNEDLKSPFRIISLEFAGGSATEYLTALKKATPGELNVLTNELAEAVAVPRITLNGVSVDSAIKLLDDRIDEDGSVVLRVDMIASSLGEPIFTVHGYRQGSWEKKVAKGTQVWSLSEMLDSGLEEDGILTAVETAIMLSGDDAEPVDVRFHDGTGLLIARGPMESLRVMENVISTLHAEAIYREQRDRKREAVAREQERQAFELQRMRTELEQREAIARDHMAEAEQLRVRLESVMQENRVLQEEMGQLRQSLLRASGEIERLQRELQAEKDKPE